MNKANDNNVKYSISNVLSNLYDSILYLTSTELEKEPFFLTIGSDPINLRSKDLTSEAS